jgi:hypothetical protein
VLSPSPHEVEAVFELPMSVLLDPAAPRREMVMARTGPRNAWVWPHPDHCIWGATAMILMHLAQLLQDEA